MVAEIVLTAILFAAVLVPWFYYPRQNIVVRILIGIVVAILLFGVALFGMTVMMSLGLIPPL